MHYVHTACGQRPHFLHRQKEGSLVWHSGARYSRTENLPRRASRRLPEGDLALKWAHAPYSKFPLPQHAHKPREVFVFLPRRRLALLGKSSLHIRSVEGRERHIWHPSPKINKTWSLGGRADGSCTPAKPPQHPILGSVLSLCDAMRLSLWGERGGRGLRMVQGVVGASGSITSGSTKYIWGSTRVMVRSP